MRLEVKNLYKTYGEDSILQDINLNIEGASTIGIIGESGCGKSTLLRLLSGIEDADRGEIDINGLSPMNDKKEFQSKIGVVFQKHNLFPHLTIKKNITLILNKIKKLDKEVASEKADELLKQLYIYPEANKLPHEVSGGQAQRASIARALATDPQLIFLDEPTAALDPLLTEEVLKAVKGLKKDGRDFIFVTHEIGFLKEFADYVIFLKNGNVCECGGRECLETPKTPELATFLKIVE
ncbi:MAG: ATP-binding cassette domain-containing protein [Eubacteriales bacterium]